MASQNEVKKILDSLSGEEAIMAIDEVLTDLFYESPEALTQAEMNIALVIEFEKEIENGGFNQFFFNTIGGYSFDILRALKEMSSKKTRELLNKAINQFPNSLVPKDHGERQELMEEIEDEADEEWDLLDEAFYEYDEDLYVIMIEYIKKNINDFR